MLKKFRKIFPSTVLGFSLMEIVVFLAIFSTTALIAVDLFLTITRVQRQVRNVQAVQTDARFALEAMGREIRIGAIDYDYYKNVCLGGDYFGNPCTDDNDCQDGICGSIDLSQPTYVLATRDQDNKQIFYRRSNEGAGDKIEVCSNTPLAFVRCNLIYSGDVPPELQSEWQNVTPPRVRVTDLRFYISPAFNPFSKKISCVEDEDCDSGNCTAGLCEIPDIQPSVTIMLEAESGSDLSHEKANLQTTITSMIYQR